MAVTLPDEALTVSADVRERVRSAVATLERRGSKLTWDSVSDKAAVKRPDAGVLLRLYKAGHLPPPGTPKRGRGRWCTPEETREAQAAEAPAPAGATEARETLADMVAAATTNADREAALRQLAKCVALGAMDDKQAREIRSALAELRHTDKHAREAPDENAAQVLLAGPEAHALVRAFEGIVSDRRRARILATVAAEFADDLAEHPDVDTGALEAVS